MLTRLIGIALMNSPLMITVRSRWAGRLNSDTPIRLNAFFPAGGAAGISFAGGAFALLGTGSVALVSVQLFGAASFRQPVTLTISTFFGGGAVCMPSNNNNVVMGPYDNAVTPSTEGTQRPQHTQSRDFSLRNLRTLRSICCASLIVYGAARISAHDLEKTQVSIVFARDGSFVADVANDPAWLTLRMQSIPGPFADRVVFWVDGKEIRPDSVELLPGPPTTNRLRGRVPLDARTLRWYYGLVVDPYPLTIRRADGRMVVEEVQGNAWSGTIDLAGQFRAPLVNQKTVGLAIAALLVLPLFLRLLFNTKDTKDTKDTEDQISTV